MEQKPPVNASLAWQEDGAPRSTLFDDPYFSTSGGLAESRHVFLAGNALPARFRPGFHIAELGFGTGLNLLAAWCSWLENGQTEMLNYTSFEAFPLSKPDLERANACWPDLSALASNLLAHWPLAGVVELEGLRLKVVIGDVQQTLPIWQGKADAWFLDGFSPSKNPDMWSAKTMLQVARHTAKAGTFATYTAAGHVRRNLGAAGFKVDRATGFGRKRHMSIGNLAD